MNSWVAPVNLSHPYLENDPAPSFDPHHLRISPWLEFSCWSAPARSMWMSRWMNRPGWVVHKRAFVTLGHKSLPSACSGVGHKGMVKSSPVGGEFWPIPTATPAPAATECPSCRAATRKPTPTVAGCQCGAFSYLSGRRRLRNLASPGRCRRRIISTANAVSSRSCNAPLCLIYCRQ